MNCRGNGELRPIEEIVKDISAFANRDGLKLTGITLGKEDFIKLRN